ncbi:MAG: phytase [Betaproteobacteria bacterium]|nr:phytase [Betaproteobacteria bacterium]
MLHLYPLAPLIMLLIALLAGAPPANAQTPPHTVTPVPQTDETHPILDLDESPAGQRLGDADDPAIWVHPDKPGRSRVIATLKSGGLEVYDMKGEVVQSIDSEPGKQSLRYNNVVVAYGFPFGGNSGRKADLAVVTDRENDQFVFYNIDPETGTLENVTMPGLPRVFTEGDDAALEAQTTAYGLGLWKTPDDEFYAFVSRRSTNVVAQFHLHPTDTGVAWELVRTLTLPLVGGDPEESQVEGMVVDQELGILYAGQEQFGIWRFDAAPDGSTEGTIVDRVAPEGQHLQPDVEGLTIYYADDGQGYLIASSQGDQTFVIYDRQTNAYLASFTVEAPRGAATHTVEECDGADVVNVPLGPRYPKGLLVVQDGRNFPPFLAEDDGEIENVNTNFKFVRWDDLARVIPGGLHIDTESYNPRKPDFEDRDDEDDDDDDDDDTRTLSPFGQGAPGPR